MNKWTFIYLLGACAICDGREPFKPRDGSIPFLVHFLSRYRGLCVGTLVSRTAVITAAVCVTHPQSLTKDTRPINVVAGTTYRHPRRGIRVQVTKILIPKWPNVTSHRGYLMQRSPAILLLKRQVPDVLAEVPLRGIAIDYKGNEAVALHDECLILGWHFFYRGNLRVQYMNVVKRHLWCETLAITYQKALTDLGFPGYADKSAYICIRDPDLRAQPCHGMYGAPLLCRGKAVAMLMAPDAQWTNCTGYSNLVHLFHTHFLNGFMNCVSSVFAPELHMDWDIMKKSIYDDLEDETYDYLPDMYDKMLGGSSSSEDV